MKIKLRDIITLACIGLSTYSSTKVIKDHNYCLFNNSYDYNQYRLNYDDIFHLFLSNVMAFGAYVIYNRK